MTRMVVDRRLLAAPVLGERGGGVGRVSELLWNVMQDTWPGDVDLVTLLRNGHSTPDATEKLRFGAELAGRQVLGRPRWILFSHLGLARVEQYVPAPWSTPYAIFLHGIEAWRPLGPRERGVLQRATLRLANSRFTAQAVAAANPGIGPIEVCPLALPKDDAPHPVRLAMAERAPRVLVVGRLASAERYKGHELLIRSWPGVVSRVPGAELVIAGEGDDAPRLEALAREFGLNGAVRFAGFLARPQLDAEYAQASVFALPSRGEGFGLVYLEAMAHGLPCLGSTNDAASEVIEDGRTGVLVDPTDVESIGRTIADLLRSPSRRAAFGEAGRARVDRHFRYDRFRTELAGLLEDAFPSASAVA